MDNEERKEKVLTILFFCNLLIIGGSTLMGMMGLFFAMLIIVPVDLIYYFIFRKED